MGGSGAAMHPVKPSNATAKIFIRGLTPELSRAEGVGLNDWLGMPRKAVPGITFLKIAVSFRSSDVGRNVL